MRFIVFALVFSTAHCWRPVGQRDPLSDPTNEYSPPVTSGVQYWAPSVRLEPPPPLRPMPWLATVHFTTSQPQALLPTVIPTTPQATTTTSATTTTEHPVASTTATPVTFSAVVIQGHSKVKKYGPVQGSINSVLHQSGKPL